MHMHNRDISQSLKLKSIFKTSYSKKSNSKKVVWGNNIVHENTHYKHKKSHEELKQLHRVNIIGNFLLRFKDCTVSPDEHYINFLNELDIHFLKPLDEKGALKENNLAVVTEIAFEYIYLHHKKYSNLFDHEKWRLHFNKNQAAEELENNVYLISHMEKDQIKLPPLVK